MCFLTESVCPTFPCAPTKPLAVLSTLTLLEHKRLFSTSFPQLVVVLQKFAILWIDWITFNTNNITWNVFFFFLIYQLWTEIMRFGSTIGITCCYYLEQCRTIIRAKPSLCWPETRTKPGVNQDWTRTWLKLKALFYKDERSASLITKNKKIKKYN